MKCVKPYEIGYEIYWTDFYNVDVDADADADADVDADGDGLLLMMTMEMMSSEKNGETYLVEGKTR